MPAARTPVLVENEANVAALGEQWFGDGAALGDYVHISGEIGVGAGIVVAGQLFRGAHGHAGELGHTTLEPDGAACTCGSRGCLELFCGQEAILRRAGLDPAVSTSTGQADGPVSTLVEHLGAGDPRALDASFPRALLAGIPMPRAAPPRVAISALGPDAAVRGAAGLVTAGLLARPGALLPGSARA